MATLVGNDVPWDVQTLLMLAFEMKLRWQRGFLFIYLCFLFFEFKLCEAIWTF